MTLSRGQRAATGIAAGIVVLCAALIGASFRADTTGVSATAESRITDAIPIPDAPADDDVANVAGGEAGDSETADTSGADADPDTTDPDTTDPDTTDPDSTDPDSTDPDATDPDSTDPDSTDRDPVRVIDEDDLPPNQDSTSQDSTDQDSTSQDSTDQDSTSQDSTSQDSTSQDSTSQDSTSQDSTSQDSTSQDSTDDSAETAASAPLQTGDSSLGTGGGVDDAECALDRLVIYAGARVNGVAGALRNALHASGFGTGCPEPLTILASNCPLQFSGVLAAGSGYDPMTSFIASSSTVERDTMSAVMAAVGFGEAEVNVLNFGYASPGDDEWMALFIPPSFDGWERLQSAAGVPATQNSICGPTGRVGG